MRLAGMPLAPSGRIDKAAHLRIEKDDSRVWPPWPAEINGLCHVGVGGKFAMVKHEAGVFIRIVLCLRSDEPAVVRGAVNFAVVEDGLAVAEDEIDIAGDIAIGKILPRWSAGLPIRRAVPAAGVDRVLVAEQSHVVEDGAVAGDFKSQSLRTRWQLRMSAVEVVFKGDVFGEKVVGG